MLTSAGIRLSVGGDGQVQAAWGKVEGSMGRVRRSAKGTALQGQEARESFEAIAQAAAVMGLSADQTQGALLAVQQMMSKGMVSAEEFVGQLGERMPTALQAAANAMGVTTAEFSRMLESGEVITADVLPRFAASLSAMIGEAVEDAAARLDAGGNRMCNAWDNLKRALGNLVSGDKDLSCGLFDQLNATMAKVTGCLCVNP